ncbi:MAG: hypothetical protein JST00_27475 [Deltaproteobacteria bacterium]|nr:hypothetical protein [Deltaproteobacteria bacterium]
MILKRRPLAVAAVLTALATSCIGLGVAAASGADDRAAAEGILKDVEASKKKEVAAEMVTRSKAALERAARLRAAGDEPRARLAEGLARTWAEAARDVLRAVEVEDRAQAARHAATDAGAIAERERALLEEGIAQSGRLRAQLEAAERESKQQPARTSTQANDLDGGAPKAAPKPAAGGKR